MSKIEMVACDGCGATYDGEITKFTQMAEDWLTVSGPVTYDELDMWPHERPDRKLHACSPTCLVVLGQRLATDKDAIRPATEEMA